MTARRLPVDPPEELVLDPDSICRDEACPIVELHLKHKVYIPRGRPPLKCPLCKNKYDKEADICTCGWTRALGRPRRPHRKTRD